jgi:hypothetical protein
MLKAAMLRPLCGPSQRGQRKLLGARSRRFPARLTPPATNWLLPGFGVNFPPLLTLVRQHPERTFLKVENTSVFPEKNVVEHPALRDVFDSLF